MKKWGMLACLTALALGINISATDVSKAAIFDPDPKVVGPDIFDPDPKVVGTDIFDPDPKVVGTDIFDPDPK